MSSGPESLCSLHAEKLEFFCLDHQQPACSVCRASETDSDRSFMPISRAARCLKKKLQTSLKPWQQSLEVFNFIHGICNQTAEHLKVQARHTERQIKEEFKKLHQFLQEEEEARIAALREEEEQKSQTMKEKMEGLSREIAALSDTIRAIEKELRAEDVSFLHNYKATVERVQRPLLEDPQLPSGALIDQAKHLGNLSFTVWDKMKEMVSYTPVVLDPNTADPDFHQSEDLTTLSYGDAQQLPDQLERSEYFFSVRGSEGFGSGTHSWDIQLGDNPSWLVGVAAEPGPLRAGETGCLWLVGCDDVRYRAFMPPEPETELQVNKPFQKIRLHLDRDRGHLTFSDPDTNTHIHTFTHTVTGRLFPYFYTDKQPALKILPLKVCVTVEQHSKA